MISEAKPHKWR